SRRTSRDAASLFPPTSLPPRSRPSVPQRRPGDPLHLRAVTVLHGAIDDAVGLAVSAHHEVQGEARIDVQPHLREPLFSLTAFAQPVGAPQTLAGLSVQERLEIG